MMNKKLKLFLLFIFSILFFSGFSSLDSGRVRAQVSCATTPPSDKPIVSLLDNHRIKITYDIPSNYLYARISRSNQPGFIPTEIGTRTGTQFGTHGISMDRIISESGGKYYYQLKTSSGNNVSYSGTTFVTTPASVNTGSACTLVGQANWEPIASPRLKSASQISSTATTATIRVVYDVLPVPVYSGRACCIGTNGQCDPHLPPPLLKIQRASTTTPSYIPWDSVSTPRTYQCIDQWQFYEYCSGSGAYGSCKEGRWTATYTIDLPPGTSDTINITGDKGTQCSYYENSTTINNVTISTSGSANVNTTPTAFSVAADRTSAGEPYSKITWNPLDPGQQVDIYRIPFSGTNRWSGTDIGGSMTASDANTKTYTQIDDLSTLPAGTYYYGASIFESSSCPFLQTAQTPFFWHGPPSNTQLKLLLWDDGVTTESLTDTRYASGSTNPTYYMVELKDNDGRPIANQPVTIVSKLTGAPLNLLTNNPVTTGSNGQVVFNIRQSTRENPEIYYAQYAGNAQYNPSTSNTVKQRCCDQFVWCEYQNYSFTTFSPGQNNNLNKQLSINKICRHSGSSTLDNFRATLNVGDSFSKGEVRSCQIDGAPQKCVVGQFKYYYKCDYNTCPQMTVNYVNPSTPLACSPSQAYSCQDQVCQGTQLDPTGAGSGAGSVNDVLLMSTQTIGGNPTPGVPPIQLACASATKDGGGTLWGWQVASLGYDTAENNRSQVYPVGCINNDDCKVNQYCDTSGNWDTWTCRQSLTPPRTVRAFVTNRTYTGALGGLSGADTKCQEEASEASGSNIENVKNAQWKAWLSTSTVDAKDRIEDAVYSLVDYTLVARNKGELLSGTLAHLINGNINGQLKLHPDTQQVWTGTNTDGTKSNSSCNDWSPGEPHIGTYGNFTMSDPGLWTNAGTTSVVQCKGFAGDQYSPPVPAVSYHLYCFEDISTVPPPPPTQGSCGSETTNATGLVTTPSLTGEFGTTGGCILDPKAAFAPFRIPDFNSLKSLYFDQSKLPKSGTNQQLYTLETDSDGNPDSAIDLNTKDKIYYINGNLRLDSPADITGSQTGVIFVNGDLNLDFSTPNSRFRHGTATSGIVFVVKGNIIIHPNIIEIDGVYISEGTIYTAGLNCLRNSITTSSLIINGSLISINQTASTPAIKFCRTLSGTQNSTIAAEKINHQIKYLPILRSLLSDTYQKWSEITTP